MLQIHGGKMTYHNSLGSLPSNHASFEPTIHDLWTFFLNLINLFFPIPFFSFNIVLTHWAEKNVLF